MELKEAYLNALIKNDGRLNDIDLGEALGLNEQETRAVIGQLLAEYKIEYLPYRCCNYRIKKKK